MVKTRSCKSLYGVVPGLWWSLLSLIRTGENILSITGEYLEHSQPSIVSLILSEYLSCYLLRKSGALGSYIRFDKTLTRNGQASSLHRDYLFHLSVKLVFAWELRRSGYLQSALPIELNGYLYIGRRSFS